MQRPSSRLKDEQSPDPLRVVFVLPKTSRLLEKTVPHSLEMQCLGSFSRAEAVKSVARYVEQVVQSQTNYDADNIGGFLRGKIPSNYVSDTGLSVNVTELYKSYTDFLLVVS